MKGLRFGVQGKPAGWELTGLRLLVAAILSFSLSSSAQDGKLLNADGDFMTLWNRLEAAQREMRNLAEDRQIRKSKLIVEIAELRDSLDHLSSPKLHESAAQYHARVVKLKAKKNAAIRRMQEEFERLNDAEVIAADRSHSGDLLVSTFIDNSGASPDATTTMFLLTSTIAGRNPGEEHSYHYVAFDSAYRMTTPVRLATLKEKCTDEGEIYSLIRGKFQTTLTASNREVTSPESPAHAKSRETCLDETRNICLNHPHVRSLIAAGKKDYAWGWCIENDVIRKQRNDADAQCNARYPAPIPVQVTSRKIQFKWNEPVQVMKILCSASGNPMILWDRTAAVDTTFPMLTGERDVVPKEFEVSIPPKLRTRVDPLYPEKARQQALEGKVFLELVVNENGEVIDARILRSTDQLFEQSALKAVMQWKYEPAQNHGQPVRTYKNVTVIYSLH